MFNIDEGKIKNSPERHEISSTCEQENIIDFKKNDYVPESRSEASSSDEEISRIKQKRKCVMSSDEDDTMEENHDKDIKVAKGKATKRFRAFRKVQKGGFQ